MLTVSFFVKPLLENVYLCDFLNICDLLHKSMDQSQLPMKFRLLLMKEICLVEGDRYLYMWPTEIDHQLGVSPIFKGHTFTCLKINPFL